MTKIIVVTSGKGGVGKTTTSASIAAGLALRGHKTAVIDFDVGLRNLDLIMGCERRVVYDLINVIQGEATLTQALIKDKNCENLFILPASQTRDKDALTREGVEKVMQELSSDKMGFEYIICDSPAGIEQGALMALYFADEAIVTTNPEVSSVRDSDRILGILQSKSRKAEQGGTVKEHLLITRYSPERVSKGEMLSVQDICDILRIPLLGVIPESQNVLQASNAGEPVIHQNSVSAAEAYKDVIARLLGENREMRFLEAEKKRLLQTTVRRLSHVINRYVVRQKAEKPPAVARDPPANHHCPKNARKKGKAPDYLPTLRKELLEVLSKYVNVSLDDIRISQEKQDGMDVLELNITLPEQKTEQKKA